jgi:simple sugar transport system permease protein
LFIAAGLLVALRGGVWNIGVDGQFLVGAILVGVLAPALAGDLPDPLLWALGAVLGAIGGLAWAVIPALLRVRYGLNEIITTIMFNYVAISLTAYLVKGPFRDESVVSPQTRAIPVAHRLADLPGTGVHLGVAVGVVAVLLVAFLLGRTTFGFKVRMLGQNRRAAVHAGYPIGRLTAGAMLISGGLAGVAGANDVLSTKGLFQANWYPEYGLAAFALVYLARLRPVLVIPAALFFGVLSLGADLVRSDDVPNYIIPLLEGLLLLCLAAVVRLERIGSWTRIASFWTNRRSPGVPGPQPVGGEP